MISTSVDPAWVGLIWTIMTAIVVASVAIFAWIVKTVWQVGIALEALRKDVATLLENRSAHGKRLDDHDERLRRVEATSARHDGQFAAHES